MTDSAPPDACPTCGFPDGQPGYLRSEFPVGHPKFGALIRCPDCHDGALACRLAEASQLTGWLKTATFDTYRSRRENKVALDAARKVAEKPTGWCTFYGTFGPGKTHLLAAIVNHCNTHRVAAVYYTLPDLMDRLRDSYTDDGFSVFYDKLVRMQVLVIDEVDKLRLTEWAKEKFYQLADSRYRELDGKLTVFALNDLPEVTGGEMDYLYSRMRDYRGQTVEVGGGDVRPIRQYKNGDE
ncbi:ATP-binding protein [Patescibacteria group bacterium]|nr:ATP-binding protein [Patescibacteria group bacterium]